MNENQMQSFAAAVEQGSMSKAARDQFLTVPSLVHRINTLEAELGYRVLDRGQQGVTPTPEGERLYRAVKQVLSILAAAKAEPHPADEGFHAISVGIWWRIPPHFLNAIEEIDLRERGIYLDYVSMNFNEAAEGFDRHVIDLYLSTRSRELEERGLRYVPMTTATYQCVFAPDSPLAQRGCLTATDLRDITVYAGADYRDMPDLAVSADAQELFAMDNVVKESIFSEKLIQDCAQGTAVAFFPRIGLANELAHASALGKLDSRPMAWPAVSTGAYLADNASLEAVQLVEDVARICRKA